MIYKKLITAGFITLFSALQTASAQQSSASIPGDFADPSIIREGNHYYAIGTSSEWGPQFPIFRSDNLQQWEQTGFLFDKAPEWTSSSFWAPEFFHHNNTYFVYYTARRKKDGISCIGVATSKYPDHGYKDQGIIIEHGKEAIDAFVYDDNGQLYITWKAYGLDKRPIEILGSKLSADGLSLTGTPFTLLKDDAHKGMEGQSIIKKDQYYYLFYSAGGCCGVDCDYNVRVARATAITGPYVEDAANPILSASGDWKCPGHGTFVKDPQGKDFYIYHAYNKNSNVFTGREGMIAQLTWNEQAWPVFNSPAFTQKSRAATTLSYNFKDDKTPIFWQWDFRHMQPVVKQANGKLILSGSYDKKDPSGIALTLRPYAAAYEISTTVTNTNDASKGLIIYGDVSAAIGIAVRGQQVECWITKGDSKTVLNQQTLTSKGAPVSLKMVTLPDFTCRFYWKQGNDWQELTPGNKPLDIKFLPPWDRSPRPGLNFAGKAGEKAEFSNFSISY